ncbi:MAG: hypothetical protein ABIM74_03735, partial [candidate division WOR-3 bacterium]
SLPDGQLAGLVAGYGLRVTGCPDVDPWVKGEMKKAQCFKIPDHRTKGLSECQEPLRCLIGGI